MTWRDARTTSIYEGANCIHGLTAATRGLKAHGGAGADAFVNFIMTLGADAAPFNSCLADWQGCSGNRIGGGVSTTLA